MKMPTLHNKLLELYVKKDEPETASLMRCVENYLHKRYSPKKLQRLVDGMNSKYDFQRESIDIKCTNHLSSYIDSIIISRIRDSYKSSMDLNIDDMEDHKFKALVKHIILNFGYETLFTPRNNNHGVDMIVHRGDKKIAVLAIKWPATSSIDAKTIAQAKYISDHYHCEQTIIITNSSFDEKALVEAQELGVTLIDRGRLLPLIQDLIDNRQRKENEFLISNLGTHKNSIYLDALTRTQKTKVQVEWVKYSIDASSKYLVFEGELVNTGKKPVNNLTVDIKIFDRSGSCAFEKLFQVDIERLNSKEKIDFQIVFDEIMESDWSNICRYEIKLDYNNLHAAD